MDQFMVEVVARPTFGPDENSGGRDRRAQFARPADEISVDVRLKNVREGNLLRGASSR